MISAWLVWRFVKYLGIALLGAGLWTAVTRPDQRDRLWAAHTVTLTGFALTWLAGYAIMKMSGRSMSEPWIMRTMAASQVALAGGLIAAMRPSATSIGAGLASAGLAASIGAMVSRGTADAALVIVGPAMVGALAAIAGSRQRAAQPDPEAANRTLRWFQWIARMEGTSLLVLLGISMPVRMIFGVSLDGGQGWIGWVHGVLVIIFVQAWIAAARAGRWGWIPTILAFVGSLIPFGTFLFEWRYLGRRGSPPAAPPQPVT